MRPHILKFSFVSLAALLLTFSMTVKVNAGTAYTLTASDQKYEVEADIFEQWRNPQKKNQVIYYLAPQTNLDHFVLEQLGAKEPEKVTENNTNYDLAGIYSYIKGLEDKINKQSKDAVFEVANGRVVNFDPGQKGISVDVKESIDRIIEDLEKGKTQTNLAVSETLPTKDLSSINNYGIKELIASGDSDFAGSPNNRIHNIKVGVQKESGVLIAPGEIFSFNKYLGPVDGEHGFLPELVIKKTGTVPEFGGGLCQVSSTVFRAAMNAGLPIVERRNHSYAVQYYAPQGTDATIYPGVVDLRFKNDTANYILVWPSFPSKSKLRFDIYGQKDERKISLGTPYSYDKKSDGSLKATWTRTVTMADGTTKKDTFNSVYQPPALFHRQETYPPKPTTPTPTNPTEPAPPSDSPVEPTPPAENPTPPISIN
jgi:vancomycin resistance protein YoaR